MRRRLWLVAAGAWLLQLGACADKPAPRTPSDARAVSGRNAHGTPVNRPKNAASSAEDASQLEPAADESAPRASDAEARRDAGATSEQLAERYGKLRAVAVQCGSASYYGDAFEGRPTASGAAYQGRGFTAAHRSLPFGSVLRVTRVDGEQSVYVRVTDRGPYGPRGRILDLSRAAAERLGMLRAGVSKIKLEVLEYGPRKLRRRRH